MPRNMFIILLLLVLMIDNFLNCLSNLFLKKKHKNTAFPMESSVLVLLSLF